MQVPSTFRWLTAAVLIATTLFVVTTQYVLPQMFTGQVASPIAPYALPLAPVPTNPAPAAPPTFNGSNKLQLAFLLDTSGSMDGLLDQAKARLWSILNQALEMERDGQTPTIEVALYQYGNDNLAVRTGYIQQVLPFTSDVDELSEKLFALTTSGGDEYCPQAIQRAANELAWDADDAVVKLLYIAGNEEFEQGPVTLPTAVRAALAKSISINTIFCGDGGNATNSGWAQAANTGNGDFFNINQNEAVAYIESPYDDQIAALNAQLNTTYVPINEEAEIAQVKQRREDANAATYSSANLAARVKYKASKSYKNAKWDLVDAATDDEEVLTTIQASLPDSLSSLSAEMLKEKVTKLSEKRRALQTEIEQLSSSREAYVAEQKAATATVQTETLGDKIKGSVRERLHSKGYQVKTN